MEAHKRRGNDSAGLGVVMAMGSAYTHDGGDMGEHSIETQSCMRRMWISQGRYSAVAAVSSRLYNALVSVSQM
jgi:hypothetical protein